MWECIAPTAYAVDWNTALGDVLQTPEEVEFLSTLACSRERLQVALRHWKQLSLRERSLCGTRQRHANSEAHLPAAEEKPVDESANKALLKNLKETLFATAGPVEVRSALYQLEAYIPCLQRLTSLFQEQRTVEHFAHNRHASESCRFAWKSGMAERRTVQRESLLRFEILFTLFYWSMAKIRIGHEILDEFSSNAEGQTREAVENEAVRLFREASGVLKYLSEKLSPGLLMDMDSSEFVCEVHPCVASALSRIAMGEAYLLALTRAESRQLSPETLLRLSVGVTETFALARAQLQGLCDGTNKAAAGHKRLAYSPEPGYRAVAELGEALGRTRCFYYQALIFEAGTSPREISGKRGAVIRLLEHASLEIEKRRVGRLLRDGAFRFLVPPMRAPTVQHWQNLISIKLEKSRRDNDLVYMEPVPDSIPNITATEALYPFYAVEYSFTDLNQTQLDASSSLDASLNGSPRAGAQQNGTNESIGGTFR
jgi:hypothetical protein